MLPQLSGQPLPAIGPMCRGVGIGLAGAERITAHGSKRQRLELPGFPGVAVGVLVPAVALEKQRAAGAGGGRVEVAGVEDQRDLVARRQDDREVVGCVEELPDVAVAAVAAGEGQPGRLGAYDKLTGDVVHEVQLPGGPTIGFPITYLAGGRQYIVVAALDGESIAELVALAIQ